MLLKYTVCMYEYFSTSIKYTVITLKNPIQLIQEDQKINLVN